MTLMAVQKHVRILEEAGLVETRKLGRSRHVKLRPKGLTPLARWLQLSEVRWHTAFDRLARALEEDNNEGSP